MLLLVLLLIDGDPDGLAGLIDRLGADSVVERERATLQLGRMGAPALLPLRRALGHPDPRESGGDCFRILPAPAMRVLGVENVRFSTRILRLRDELPYDAYDLLRSAATYPQDIVTLGPVPILILTDRPEVVERLERFILALDP